MLRPGPFPHPHPPLILQPPLALSFFTLNSFRLLPSPRINRRDLFACVRQVHGGRWKLLQEVVDLLHLLLVLAH